MTEETLPPGEPIEGEIPPAPSRPAEITITFRRAHLFAVLMPLAFVLGIGLGYLLWGQETDGTAAQASGTDSAAAAASAAGQQQASATTAIPQVTRYDVPVDDDPVYGPADAPITIVEFSDFECPYCQKWYAEVYERLKEQYPQEVRLVFRDFPIESIHANAFPAAEAANCANEQGEFWPFHDKLFSMEKGLNAEAYTQYASDLGLNVEDFNACLESGKFKPEVQSDLDFAANLGVRSTPTFFINGIALVGAQPFEVFQDVIDKELAGEIPK
jgi:protein-disulfide isomerase